MAQLDGCNQLPFHASISATPDVSEASKPSGLTVDVHVPQAEALTAEGLAPTELRNITVQLPAGVHLNPSASDGLQACSEGLAGYLAGESNPPEDLRFTPRLPGGDVQRRKPRARRELLRERVEDRRTSKIHTPLLPNPVTGFVYLAAQEANPFESVIAMYLVAEDPESGTVVKLPGEVSLCKGAGEVSNGDDLPGAGSDRLDLPKQPRSCRSKTPNCTSSAANAPRWRPPPAAASYTTQRSFDTVVGRTVRRSGAAPARLLDVQDHLRPERRRRVRVRACRSARR